MDLRIVLALILFSGTLAKIKQPKKTKENKDAAFIQPFKEYLASTREAEKLLKNLLANPEPNLQDPAYQYYLALAVQEKVAQELAHSCLKPNNTETYMTVLDESLPDLREHALTVVPKLKKILVDELELTQEARNLVDDVCDNYENCDGLLTRFYDKNHDFLNLTVLLEAGEASKQYVSLHPLIESAAEHFAVEDLLYSKASEFANLSYALGLLLRRLYPFPYTC